MALSAQICQLSSGRLCQRNSVKNQPEPIQALGLSSGKLEQISAYKQAEKHYQHKTLPPSRRGSKRAAKSEPADLSQALDTQQAETSNFSRHTIGNCPVLTVAGHPGLVILPGFLPPPVQLELFRQALDTYSQPPNTTNHTAQHGPLPDLWQAAQQGWHLRAPNARGAPFTLQTAANAPAEASEKTAAYAPAQASEKQPGAHLQAPASQGDAHLSIPSCRQHQQCHSSHLERRRILCPGLVEPRLSCWSEAPGKLPATRLFRQLRWAALGQQYNWTLRRYEHLPGVPDLPPQLQDIALCATQTVAPLIDDSQSTAPQPLNMSNAAGLSQPLRQSASCNAGSYHPDTALVNYYRLGDTLGGHKDDAEADMSQPIVSISLGCAGVFLKGGDTKDTAPAAIILHSGDVVVLHGHARRCYHGLPRVLPGAISCGPDEDYELNELLRDLRINISIRQAL